MGVLCEEFLRKGIPLVILDRHGEYASLKVRAEDADEIIETGGGDKSKENEFCPWCGAPVPSGQPACHPLLFLRIP